MGKLYANRTLMGNIALVVFLAFLVTLTLGSFTPAAAQSGEQTRQITVLDKDGRFQTERAILRTDQDRTKVTLTIRITPLTQDDFSNIWFVIRDGQRVLKTVYASDATYSEVYSEVYGAGYQFVYAWAYSFTGLLPLEVSLVVYESGKQPKSIALTIEAPPPRPAPGPGPAPAPAPVKHEVATGTVEVKDGLGTLTVDAAKVEKMLADPAVKAVVFSIPTNLATQGTVAVSADLLARVLEGNRSAVVEIGGAKLAIPPGALDLSAFKGQNVTLNLSVTKGESPVPAAAAYRIAGEVYRFSIEAYAAGERKGAIRNFDKPITLTLPYDPAKLAGAREDDLSLFRYNETAKRWDAVPGSTVDKRNKTVSAPRDSLSLYTVMVRVFTPPQFTDISGHWAEHDINLMAGKGIAGGYPDGTFRPNANVTRAQFAALLIRTLGITEQAAKGGRFTDVAAKAWYAGAVETAAAAGLVGGYPDGSFKPNANITRQELAAMVTRGLAYQGKDVKLSAAEVEAILARFSDAAKISPWARNVAAVAADQGIVGGRTGNTFAPQENATRAEAIVMLKRMLAATGKL
ncbi:S-layer homology domain-containing protein [Candidatus Desulforudis audaxviator]|uniref:S-layer domain protein n=1 Tax=Desulforudis audaxviator (strain MP104C) TaxID=477974 RepID=B1I5D6_DESAP|nr:S-layer homology domain-containing protein [Candidatus Desulforudis audaxviator]ACA60212.1 S-layer domain protein [Candidatus Desulforudis audaxviator MP104C]AZK60258.1 hypothetical protein Daudx_1715 [Candidatus Desulforudis audaxviator]